MLSSMSSTNLDLEAMSSTQTARGNTLAVPHQLGNGSTSMRQSSRVSSRRRTGSTSPLLLGAGAGALGGKQSSMANSVQGSRYMSASPFLTQPPSLSPTSPSFPSSATPQGSQSQYNGETSGGTSHSTQAASTSQSHERDSSFQASSSSEAVRRAVSPVPALDHSKPRSTTSISTAATTSSRTLKTPHSKTMYEYPAPVLNLPSSSDSLASNSGLSGSPSTSAPMVPSKGRERDMIGRPSLDLNYALSRPSEDGRRSGEMIRSMKSTPAPPLAQGPLPPTPMAIVPLSLESAETKAKPAVKSSNKPRRNKSPHLVLDTNKEKRLSQDWVQIAEMDLPPPEQPRTKSPSPPLQYSRDPRRLPAATMVPMKQAASSPQRPRFDRTMTAPPLSPTDGRSVSGPPRGSLDHFRSTSPAPARGRVGSLSTPPEALLEGTSTTGGRLHLWRSGPTPPTLTTRRSEDLLRPSTDSQRAGLSKKELKALQKEQQRGLGVAFDRTATPPPFVAEDRKSSGISMKKSSGALKALFKRGASGKGKEKEDTPPLPSMEFAEARSISSTTRPSSSYEQYNARPSFTRPRTPNNPSLSPSPNLVSGDDGSGLARSSFSAQRIMYPSPPTLQRAASQGARSVLDTSRAGLGSDLKRPPSRGLPALPPPSPEPPAEPKASNKQTTPSLPTSSSLPYLDEVSTLHQTSPPTDQPSRLSPVPTISPPPKDSPSSTSSVSTTRPISPINDIFASIKPSASLHLLQLPDLDLSFDFAFDRIGLSPSTPRKRRSPSAVSPSTNRLSPGAGKQSPSRTMSVSRRPSTSPTKPMVGRSLSERRRSQSFDGFGTAPSVGDMWRSPSDLTPGLFGSTASSTATFSRPIEPPPIQLSPDFNGDRQPRQIMGSHSHTDSFSSQPSAPSSSDHARTPSNASSTNETPSPSPPHTPRDERSLAGLGFGEGVLSSVTLSMSTSASSDSGISTTPTPTGSAKQDDQMSMGRKPFVLNQPPTIPLPALPVTVTVSTVLQPAAVIEKVEEEKKICKPRENVKTLTSRSKVVTVDPQVSLKAIGREVQRLLYAFRYPSQNISSSERASIIRTELLTCLVEIEKRGWSSVDDMGNLAIRDILFEWSDTLLNELRVEQPANERGACLEGLAAVMESCCLSEVALERSGAHQERFTQLMIATMTFVMGKLGAKGVFHNTLLFSGRFLAFAFFRVPHVGEQLVTVLPPPRGALMRFTKGVVSGPPIPASATPRYPQHLLPLCFDDSRKYTARLASLSAEFATEEEREAFLFQPGNWLRRWQSDDSELFPAFYRAYHRQLAAYLAPLIEHYEKLNRPIPANALLRAPGYAHLATIFAKKCHSYILGSVNAVTTSSSAQHFDATESAGLRGSQKPAVLETANRRLVETISTFANARVYIPVAGASTKVIECDGSQLWSDMIDVWAKSLISKTSLFAPKGVFSLFDLLDGIVDPPQERVFNILEESVGKDVKNAQLSLLDVPYLIHVIRLILTEGEHALTLVKVIAFVFTHWEVLCARPEDRRELCLDLLLNKKLFERLLLFWSQSVRSYVLRLVVFRLGHLHTTKDDGAAYDVEIESVKLLQTRLARIKKRHDELEPRAPSEGGDEDVSDVEEFSTPFGEGGMPRSRSTITMVGTGSPRVGGGAPNKAERLLGLGFGMNDPRSSNSISSDTNEDGTRIGKATNWLKKSFGSKQKKRKDGTLEWSSSPNGSPLLGDSSPVMPSLSSSPTPSSKFTTPSGKPSPRLGNSLTIGPTPGILRVGGGIPSPSLPSPASFGTTTSSIGDGEVSSNGSQSPSISGERKNKPASIKISSDASPSLPPVSGLSSPKGVAFEFELPTMSPRSDTFDPTPTTSSSSTSSSSTVPSSEINGNGRRNSQPPSPRQPPSPHMSRSFSKRSSLLPPSTASALEGLMAGSSGNGKNENVKKIDEEEDKGYDAKLHAYAIRMLAELEDAQKEYDEWWSDGGIGKMDGAPPRLTVAWPFHEGEE